MHLPSDLLHQKILVHLSFLDHPLEEKKNYKIDQDLKDINWLIY